MELTIAPPEDGQAARCRRGALFARIRPAEGQTGKYAIIPIEARTGPHRAAQGQKRRRLLKALSIHPYYVMQIFAGRKTIEVRSWETNYRGDLLICSTAKKFKDTIPGHALLVARLADVVPFAKKHVDAAFMLPQDWEPGLYAWMLEDIRIIKPIPLKGQLGLWNYNGPIEYLEEPKTDEEDEQQFNLYWRDLFI